MAKRKEDISTKLVNIVLYKSARTCCVCRIPGNPVEIHHINFNSSNNVESNLVAICRNCHDEAHRPHTMSRSLSPGRLKDTKKKWEKEVEIRSSVAMTSKANLSQAVWTFINHQRLPQVMKAFRVDFESKRVSFLEARGVVDSVGLPIFSKPSPPSKTHVTIYDRMDWDDSQQLHYLYSEAIDDLIEASHPIEIGAIWSKTEIKDIVSPGDICFCMRGFRFRSGENHNQEEDRLVYASARGVKIRLFANTRHMYGSSALYDSFSGHRFAAVLMMVKNITNEDGFLVIRATPLAMGAGFVPSFYKTPYPLKYGWAKPSFSVSSGF